MWKKSWFFRLHLSLENCCRNPGWSSYFFDDFHRHSRLIQWFNYTSETVSEPINDANYMKFNWNCCFRSKTNLIGVARLSNGKDSKGLICHKTLFQRFWMNHPKLAMPKSCLLLWRPSSIFEEIHKFRRGFVVCFQNMKEETWIKSCKTLETAQINSQVTNNITILQSTSTEMLQIKFLFTHAVLVVSRK